MRKEISECLFKGSLLPLFRKDFLQLINSIDEIANKSETVCDFCISQRPIIPEELKADFLTILNTTTEMFYSLKKCLSTFVIDGVSYDIEDKKLMYSVVNQINEDESKIDDLKWNLQERYLQVILIYLLKFIWKVF